MTSTSTNANGSPKMIVAYCRARMPPTTSIATVSRPVTAAQRMRSHGGAVVAGRCAASEHRLAITSAPESAEVT